MRKTGFSWVPPLPPIYYLGFSVDFGGSEVYGLEDSGSGLTSLGIGGLGLRFSDVGLRLLV